MRYLNNPPLIDFANGFSFSLRYMQGDLLFRFVKGQKTEKSLLAYHDLNISRKLLPKLTPDHYTPLKASSG